MTISASSGTRRFTSFANAGIFRQLLEILRYDSFGRVFIAEPHRHFVVQLGIVDRAYDVVERREADLNVISSDAAIQKRKVLPVRVVVADKVVVNHGVEQPSEINHWGAGNIAQQGKGC